MRASFFAGALVVLTAVMSCKKSELPHFKIQDGQVVPDPGYAVLKAKKVLIVYAEQNYRVELEGAGPVVFYPKNAKSTDVIKSFFERMHRGDFGWPGIDGPGGAPPGTGGSPPGTPPHEGEVVDYTNALDCCKDLNCRDDQLCYAYSTVPGHFACDCAPIVPGQCDPPCSGNEKCYIVDGKGQCGNYVIDGGGIEDEIMIFE